MWLIRAAKVSKVLPHNLSTPFWEFLVQGEDWCGDKVYSTYFLLPFGSSVMGISLSEIAKVCKELLSTPFWEFQASKELGFGLDQG